MGPRAAEIAQGSPACHIRKGVSHLFNRTPQHVGRPSLRGHLHYMRGRPKHVLLRQAVHHAAPGRVLVAEESLRCRHWQE